MELNTRVGRLEDALAQLAAAQARAEQRFDQFVAAQARTEARLEELAAAQRDLAAAQARTEARLEELAAAQARTEARLEELAAAQAWTEARLEELAAAQARTEARLEEVARIQRQSVEQLSALVSWQQGTEGRLKGERYERDTVRRAYQLFRGGDGGTTLDEPVRRRLGALLIAVEDLLPPEDDPSLADVQWWKGDQMVVGEISLVVDDDGVERAHRRAQALRRAGAQVLPVVIGQN